MISEIGKKHYTQESVHLLVCTVVRQRESRQFRLMFHYSI